MNKEEIMEDNRKGTWEDVTGECTVDLDGDEVGTVNVRHPGREIRLTLYGNSMKPWAAQGGADFLTEEHKDEANSYRVTANPESNGFKVEHFIPDPKEEWVNVTEECKVRTYNFPTLGSWFALEHKGNAVAHLGAETKILARDNYRVTLDDFGKGTNHHPGHVKVEKRND